MFKWPEPRCLAAFLCLSGFIPLCAARDIHPLYNDVCAGCHGENRLGGQGPALLPENLQRLPRDEAAEVIRSGRAASQMPAFAGKLQESDITSLVEFIYQPLAEIPVWNETQIRNSHQVYQTDNHKLSKPVYSEGSTLTFLKQTVLPLLLP